MFKNYLKIAFRNFKKHKGFSLINVIGLSVGIACCILIFLWVQDELSYDSFHNNSDTLSGVFFSNGSPVTPPALAGFLNNEYPEIVNSSRFSYVGRIKLKYGEKEFMENRGAFVDQSFLEMFTLEFISGNAENAFLQPLSVVVTETFAKKYFGDEDALGKAIIAEGMDFNIGGVIKDYPRNSHIQFDFLLPFILLGNFGRDLNDWKTNWHRTYVQLHEQASTEEVNQKIAAIVQNYDEQETRDLLLRPITRIHLFHLNGGGPIVFVYTFSAIAFFILLIACINFMNLSTAQSSKRNREVGLRKTVGAQRNDLIKQFYYETFMVTFLALLFGIVIAELALPVFNELTGKQFAHSAFINLPAILMILSILTLTGILAGSYPALFLSSFKPAKVLAGMVKGDKGSLFRKVLVVFQFTLSIALIFCTLVLFKQIKFVRSAPLGFDKDYIITTRIGSRISSQLSAFKNSLYENPDIIKMTTTNIPPYRWNTNAGYGDVHWEGQKDKKIKMVQTIVDYDYAETFRLQIIDGRFFSTEFSTDATEAWVINEAAVREMGMDSPVGKWLKLWEHKKRIIGVVKDFHYESLHNPIMPMAMRIYEANTTWTNAPWACIKISPQNVQPTLKFLEKKWLAMNPDQPFEYMFLENQINNLYMEDERIGTLFRYFTILAIIISCLGLFGLATFLALDRTKEIGIRKVLGASVFSLMVFMSKDFIKWVLIANIFGWLLGWFVMNQYLQIYAFKISIGFLFFLFSGILALVIALITVSYQSIKAAIANPVESLRYE